MSAGDHTNGQAPILRQLTIEHGPQLEYSRIASQPALEQRLFAAACAAKASPSAMSSYGATRAVWKRQDKAPSNPLFLPFLRTAWGQPSLKPSARRLGRAMEAYEAE